MSHNVHLQGVKFSDLSILERAVKELQLEGLDGTFVKEKTTIRGYTGYGGNPVSTVDAAIKLPNQSYDIGFNWDSKQNAYVPYFENGFQAPGLAADFGTTNVEGEVCRYRPQEAWLGKLSQRYAVLMAERNAARNSLPTRRIVEKKTGQIHLEVTHRG